MAPHSRTLAWKMSWTEEPGSLQSMESLRVGHDRATSLSLFTFMHWRRKWQPTSVFLPGDSQGRGSLVGCRLWGHTESDTTEAPQQHGLLAPKVNWRSPCGQFISSVCLGFMCWSWRSLCGYFLQLICELSWVCLAWDLEISFHPFQLSHHTLFTPNFLPNKIKFKGHIQKFKDLLYFQHMKHSRGKEKLSQVLLLTNVYQEC